MNTSQIYSEIQAENWPQTRNLLQAELEPMEHEFKVRFAVKCAYLVLPIFEKKHSKDNRPRTAIEAVEKWLKEPIEENRKAASAASAAAYAAADAAASAASAAYAAANAASAAADAAYAAEDRKSMWLNIIGMYETMVREEKLACL
jgi:hypothetical protein